MAEATLARGLKDVVLDTTESSFIDGEQGILLYRGYNIHDLAAKSNFEEVCYLLLHGELPTKAELDAFHKRLVESPRPAAAGHRRHPAGAGRPPDGRAAHRRLAPSPPSTPTPRT